MITHSYLLSSFICIEQSCRFSDRIDSWASATEQTILFVARLLQSGCSNFDLTVLDVVWILNLAFFKAFCKLVARRILLSYVFYKELCSSKKYLINDKKNNLAFTFQWWNDSSECQTLISIHLVNTKYQFRCDLARVLALILLGLLTFCLSGF